MESADDPSWNLVVPTLAMMISTLAGHLERTGQVCMGLAVQTWSDSPVEEIAEEFPFGRLVGSSWGTAGTDVVSAYPSCDRNRYLDSCRMHSVGSQSEVVLVSVQSFHCSATSPSSAIQS